ncbi:solute carrier family 22 member 15-like isoform X2 [Penaeus japonicus]|uniref:solute carrier family 22 member 15-like isoform X2 n=1 Tax=Penaeus japonicus TaxID=27405 RepID=UPI001C716658|nr:solute carrier family 22 member 15-like isoform X2 [Penaeus japonicus]
MHLSIDDVYGRIGHFGNRQKIYFFVLCSLNGWCAFHQLLTVFVGLDPSFECYAKNASSEAKPLIDKCINNDPQECRISYTSEYKSFASEWNLICSEKYKVALVQSVWMGGVMTGALVLGSAADVVGRLKTLMVSILGTIAFEGFSAFAPTLMTMILLRFLGGVCCALVILVSFVLSQELIGTNWRSFCGMCVAMVFAVGIGIYSWLASIMSDWRTLTLVCSLLGIVFLLLPCYVPESPRWLITQGRNDEAKVILEYMAKKNGKSKELPSHWEVKSTGGKNKEKKSNGVRDLVSHPYVLVLTLIQIFSWFVNSCTYYGLTMAASNLGGDVYISTALSGLIEIPACITAASVIDRIGRRITLCSAMLLGGTACICIQFIPVEFVTVITGLALCGKLSISASFSVAYVHSAEIFPTVIRNSAVGIVSVAARVGGIVAPFILMLGDYVPNMQFTVFGLMTFLAGILNLKLPETLGQPMPENITDVIAFRSVGKVVNSGKKYQKLKMVDEEMGAETVRPRTPTRKGEAREDQEPLLEE